MVHPTLQVDCTKVGGQVGVGGVEGQRARPEGMFELEIPNDLKAVDDAIREYYEIPRGKAKKEDK